MLNVILVEMGFCETQKFLETSQFQPKYDLDGLTGSVDFYSVPWDVGIFL